MQLSAHRINPLSCTSHNGSLYWFGGCGEIIIHDPYVNKVCYVVVEKSPPLREGDPPCRCSFSVSQRSLLASGGYCNPGFNVWEPEEEEGDHQPKWRFLTSSGDLREYMVSSSHILKWMDNTSAQALSIQMIETFSMFWRDWYLNLKDWTVQA